MALVLRPSDNKVLSISRKKLHCHEAMYARFDPASESKPKIEFTDFIISESDVNIAIDKANDYSDYVESKHNLGVKHGKNDVDTIHTLPHVETMHVDVPQHVLSVKCLSDYKRNPEFNTSAVHTIPKHLEDYYNNGIPQQIDLGEKINDTVQDPLKLNEDLLLEEITKFKRSANKDGITDSIVKALNKVEEKLLNKAPRRGGLSKKRGIKVRGVNTSNIVNKKKMRNIDNGLGTHGDTIDCTNQASMGIKALDRVRILTKKFGAGYAKGKNKYTHGIVRKVIGKDAEVLWEDGETMKSHVSNLKRVESALSMVCDLTSNNTDLIWPYKTLMTILPVLEVGSCLSESDVNKGGNWPKYFYEALVRPDWRLWVEAVKSENESWDTFDACEEISYNKIQTGASVIPLGELFTIKRSGKYKFRQIALENLLKEGKDYGETFASTVSGDGLRWFCSLAVTCGMPVKG
jgi:hypothetical protein